LIFGSHARSFEGGLHHLYRKLTVAVNRALCVLSSAAEAMARRLSMQRHAQIARRADAPQGRSASSATHRS
jgi:hypothetical protein